MPEKRVGLNTAYQGVVTQPSSSFVQAITRCDVIVARSAQNRVVPFSTIQAHCRGHAKGVQAIIARAAIDQGRTNSGTTQSHRVIASQGRYVHQLNVRYRIRTGDAVDIDVDRANSLCHSNRVVAVRTAHHDLIEPRAAINHIHAHWYDKLVVTRASKKCRIAAQNVVAISTIQSDQRECTRRRSGTHDVVAAKTQNGQAVVGQRWCAKNSELIWKTRDIHQTRTDGIGINIDIVGTTGPIDGDARCRGQGEIKYDS